MKTRLQFALLLALCIAAAPTTIFAEGTGTWSTPIRLSDSGHASRPFIKADPYGGVHVVWAEGSGDRDEAPDSIYYTQLVDGAWTPPIDIVATTLPETAIPEALEIDNQGQLVLLWQAGARLLISRASVAETGSARSWRTSVVATEVTSGGGSLQIGADGSYHLVFVTSTQALSYVSSSDGGATWSAESQITRMADASSAIGEPYLAADQSNNYYVVWSRHTEATDWGPAGVWFARSTDGGASWSAAQEISAASGHGWPDVYPDSRGRLRLTWIGNLASGGRYQVISDDLGATFGNAAVIATPDQARGYAGRPQTLEDSGQVVHLVFGGLGNSAPDSIWYTKTSGEAWSSPIRLSASSPDSQAPTADIGLGHLLHVAWTDYAEYNIDYSANDTGSPALAAAPKPAITVQHAVVAPLPTDTAPLSIPTGEATATHAVEFESIPLSPNSQDGASQATPLILGVAPALLLVVAVTGVLLIRRRQR